MEELRPIGYTTKEESNKLLSLGVNPNPSDRFYDLLSGEEEPITGKWFEYDGIKENDIGLIIWFSFKVCFIS